MRLLDRRLRKEGECRCLSIMYIDHYFRKKTKRSKILFITKCITLSAKETYIKSVSLKI